MYYYIHLNGDFIYLSMISISNYVEVSLYRNSKLLKRKSLFKGVHTILHNELKLEIYIKLFDRIISFYVNDEIFDLKRVKRKELRTILQEKGYHNDLNPAPTPKKPINYRKFVFALILILLGILIQYSTLNSHRLWFIPTFIFYFIAIAMILGPLVNKIPDRHVDNEAKVKLKFLIGVFPSMVLQDSVRYLFLNFINF